MNVVKNNPIISVTNMSQNEQKQFNFEANHDSSCIQSSQYGIENKGNINRYHGQGDAEKLKKAEKEDYNTKSTRMVFNKNNFDFCSLLQKNFS